MKLKAIFALVSLVMFVSGNAHAVLTVGDANPNQTMAFAFVDTDTNLSHIIDTNILVTDLYTIGSGPEASTGFSINVLDLLPGAPADLLSSTGEGFRWSFVGGVTASSDFSTPGYGGSFLPGYVSGFAGTDMPVEQVDRLALANLISNNLGVFFDDNANGTNTTDATSGVGRFDGAWQGNFGGNQNAASFTTSNTMTLWGTGFENTVPGQPVFAQAIAELGTLTLDQATGLLTYTPVPLPAAVWLLGSALLALVGFGRRSSDQQSQAIAA